MEKQEITVTELKQDAAVIEEKTTYERNVRELKNEIDSIRFRKESIFEDIKRNSKVYKDLENKEKTLLEVLAKLEPKEESVDDILNSL